MRVFQEGNNITVYFEKMRSKIDAKLLYYDYKQLKEFSIDEIESVAEIGKVSDIIIDFDSPIYSIKQGKMKTYNHFRSSFEPEYFIVDSLDVFVKIPVIQGAELLKYQGNYTLILCSARPIDYSEKTENGEKFLTFEMQFKLSDIERLDKEKMREKTQNEYEECIYGAKTYYSEIKKEIVAFNNSLVNYIKKKIDDIVRKDSVLDIFSQAIGVELTSKNPEQEKGKKVIITPKKITLPEKRSYEGYYFDRNNYTAILQTIREHLVATEILPKPIQKLSDEELIRDTILWSLNANYIVATGETFRAAGKTDISVSFENKSAFIAECKVWRSSTTFSDALEQIYGYATWRDCRIAILIFNIHNQDFGAVLAKVENDIKAHPNYISGMKKNANEWECKFKSKTDFSASITVNVFVSDYCLRK